MFMKKSHKKSKPSKPAKPRNPFAGRPQSGAGFHEETKYGKKNRHRKKEELDEELKEDGSD